MINICDKCKDNTASHSVGDEEMCCKCYVEDGNAPADWHSVCMKTYYNLQSPNIKNSDFEIQNATKFFGHAKVAENAKVVGNHIMGENER